MGITLAIDAMGGDVGPAVTVPAAMAMVRRYELLTLIMVGQTEVLQRHLAAYGSLHPRLRLHQASEIVAMDEPPAQALRGKKDSSMRVALNLVKDGEAAACISAGNTGALMAISRSVLKMLPGIDRPAIASALPTMHGKTYMLDLGANVDCTAEHLLQFGVMAMRGASAGKE